MAEALLAVVRCGCGGRLGRRTEQTARGLRWAFACEGCGSRWGHRDGVFGPLDGEQRDGGAGGLAEEEAALLAWFRRLPGALRAEAVAQVRALAVGGRVDGTQIDAGFRRWRKRSAFICVLYLVNHTSVLCPSNQQGTKSRRLDLFPLCLGGKIRVRQAGGFRRHTRRQPCPGPASPPRSTISPTLPLVDRRQVSDYILGVRSPVPHAWRA